MPHRYSQSLFILGPVIGVLVAMILILVFSATGHIQFDQPGKNAERVERCT